MSNRLCTIALCVLAAWAALGAAAPAYALDCSAADTLTCGARSKREVLGIGKGVPTAGTFCLTNNGYNEAFLYRVQVDTLTQIIVSQRSSPTNATSVFLLGSCDENDCVWTVTGGLNGIDLTVCLSPGTFYLAVSTTLTTNVSFDIDVACMDCIVTPVESSSWGALKSRYE
jgi:hypothetical protein